MINCCQIRGFKFEKKNYWCTFMQGHNLESLAYSWFL